MAPESDTPQRVPWLPVSEGASAATPAEPEPLTPTKPPVPAWIQRDPVPQTVEDEEERDVVAPVNPPAANELLPALGESPTGADDWDDEPSEGHDPVQLLGASAVASATLSAAGAPTPLGGVPLVPADHAVDAPSFADGSPAFTPQFVGDTAAPEAEPEAPADTLANGIVDHERERLALRAAALDAGTAYAPVAFDVAPLEPEGDEDVATEQLPAAASEEANPTPASGGEAPTETQADEGEPPAEPPAAPPAKGKGKWWLWVVIALVAIAVGLGIFALLYKPEPVVNPGATVTLSPPAATITPIAAPTATDFQAAMPTTVGTFSLVEATALDPTDVALGAGRIADGVDLTYRSGSDTMTVRAFQYYTEDEAKEMFTHFAGETAVTTPVEVGGAVVGESAPITEPVPGMIWRNGTSLFILTGPAAQVQGFYEQFGL